jgi:hypothetical protein
MSFQPNSNQTKYRSIIIASIIALSLIVATVYGKYNPISQKLNEVNENILRERKPDLFLININLNDYNLNQLELKQIEKLYTSQPCYLAKYYSVEEIVNNQELEPEKDFDKDGLTNSQEMVLNSNPREKQTQPGFDDLVLYQDSKSPFNSKLINKEKIFYVNKNYLNDDGENLSNILNKNCELEIPFFELLNSERLSIPTELLINHDAFDKGFNLFFKKNIELIKNRELDLYLNAFGEDQATANADLENSKKNIELLKTFIIEKEDSINFMTLNDYYNKCIKLYNTESRAEKADIYKEIIYIINHS